MLLKFLDARKMLAVQVHLSDAHKELLPTGETGKTEAWVVLQARKESRIYADLKPGTNADDLRRALTNGMVANDLVCFTPRPGDAVFLPAGTVHSLGGDIVVFEIQENSDVTFRLCDWDHIEAKTGRPRTLQVDQALACIDFAQGKIGPVAPVVEATTPVARERLFQCEQFRLWRLCGKSRFTVGAVGVPRVLVCIEGAGQIEHGGTARAPSEKATYGSCRRRSERVLFGRSAQ